MDFSNLKKIFYIVAIVSMLLSIKSKVFASNTPSLNDFPTIPELYDNQNFIITKSFNNTYYYLFILNSKINSDRHVWHDTNPTTLTFPSDSGKVYRTPINNGTSWAYYDSIESSNHSDRAGFVIGDILLSSVDIYKTNNVTIFFERNYFPIIYPYFDDPTEIENGNPDGVYVTPGDYSRNDNLYFHLLQIDTGLSNSDASIYYYSDKTFLLNKNSEYFRTWVDPNIPGYYYYISRYKLGLSQNTSYLYVLNNSPEQIQNSQGIYAKDEANGIYDVIQSDTAGVITATEEESDRMKNIEQSLIQNQETTNNISDTLSNTTVPQETETDINSSLNFNNQNQQLTSLNNGFFSRLTSMLSNLLGYDLSEDTSVNIPFPNSNKSLVLHSIDIHNNVTGALRLIINAFWVYMFSFYLWKFINKIYIAVSTGHILDTFSSSGEAITNDML